ncbi:MAG: acireductone synthase [Deltaproteobacteria bacterium]|nr:acireductone synthase [Deltaproteobacteria bacterium]
MTDELDPPGDLRLAIFDIEGTTTSIAFVYDVLFPYARAAIPAFVATRWHDPEVRFAATLMGADASPEAAIERALALMDGDVKDTGLKLLQGLVWADGYGEGQILGHVYPDVAPAFEALRARGVTLAIYSSGSVAAQKLIFGRSEAGDLTRLLSGFFDTTTGPKKIADSYRTIVGCFGVAPADALFFTDNLDEARAAREAGLGVRVMRRPGNPPLPAIAADEAPFVVWDDFTPLLT